jgi:hypothetical protein
MALTYTRTHTHYFDSDDIDELARIAQRMEADWRERSPHIDVPTRCAGDNRLSALMAAIVLAGERVP